METKTTTDHWLGARRRRTLLWVVGAVVSAAVGYRLGTPAVPPALFDLLGVPTATESTVGVLVLHPDDCASAWRFLELLARPTVRSRLPVVATVVTAPPGNADWYNAMPHVLRSVPTVGLAGAAALALAPLGLQGTPTLLIFRDRLLVGIERAPATAMEFVALGRRLDPTLGKPSSPVVPNSYGPSAHRR